MTCIIIIFILRNILFSKISRVILLYSNSIEPTRLRWKFFFLSTVILVLSFIEHVLSMFNSIEGYDWNAPNSTFRNFLEVYTLRSHSFLFDTRERLHSSNRKPEFEKRMTSRLIRLAFVSSGLQFYLRLVRLRR